MFKYSLGQLIWYIMEGKLCSAPILARMCIENLHNDWSNTPEQERAFLPFGFSEIRYGTCHGTINENEAFESKVALIAFLSKEA